jgi:hypothetical protein
MKKKEMKSRRKKGPKPVGSYCSICSWKKGAETCGYFRDKITNKPKRISEIIGLSGFTCPKPSVYGGKGKNKRVVPFNPSRQIIHSNTSYGL